MRDRKGPRETQKTEAKIVLMGLQVKKSQGAGKKLGERHGRIIPVSL